MSNTKKAPKRISVNNSEELARCIVAGMQEKKAKDIVALNLKNLPNAITDYFIICNADSRTQVEAIARGVEEEVDIQMQEDPFHKEGFENAEWILLDYSNVVVHVFQTDKRDFYGIERLWADAELERYEVAEGLTK